MSVATLQILLTFLMWMTIMLFLVSLSGWIFPLFVSHVETTGIWVGHPSSVFLIVFANHSEDHLPGSQG